MLVIALEWTQLQCTKLGLYDAGGVRVSGS